MDVKEKLKREIWIELQKDLGYHNTTKLSPEPVGLPQLNNNSIANDAQTTSALQPFSIIESSSDATANISEDRMMQGNMIRFSFRIYYDIQ